MKSIPLIGYSDKISLRSEETISFKVSSTLKTPFSASLKRSISADPNPLSVGIIEEDASKYFKTTSFRSRTQDFNPGSYAISKKSIKINIKKELRFSVDDFLIDFAHVIYFINNVVAGIDWLIRVQG